MRSTEKTVLLLSVDSKQFVSGIEQKVTSTSPQSNLTAVIPTLLGRGAAVPRNTQSHVPA